MILVECPQLLTSHITSVLKPYIGEAHLISSILVLTQLINANKFSFFGREETYIRLKKLLPSNICLSYNVISCDVAFIDVTAYKKGFYNLIFLKDWLNSIEQPKKVLLYDVFKEGHEIFKLSEYLLLRDDILLTEKV